MSQQRCSNFQKLFLELLYSSGDDPYIFEKLRKSSTTFLHNIFPDSEVNLAEDRKIPDLSKFWNNTETYNCKYHISGSTYPNKFQLTLLESLANFLKHFYRILFQIL